MGREIYLIIYDYSKNKSFKKEFENEFEKDKFKNKLMFSKKLVVLKDSAENYYLD